MENFQTKDIQIRLKSNEQQSVIVPNAQDELEHQLLGAQRLLVDHPQDLNINSSVKYFQPQNDLNQLFVYVEESLQNFKVNIDIFFEDVKRFRSLQQIRQIRQIKQSFLEAQRISDVITSIQKTGLNVIQNLKSDLSLILNMQELPQENIIKNKNINFIDELFCSANQILHVGIMRFEQNLNHQFKQLITQEIETSGNDKSDQADQEKPKDTSTTNLIKKKCFPDGSTYEGEFKDNKRDGMGKHLWPDGSSYEGEFKNDKRNGKGKFIWANGESYEGEYYESKRNGKGIFLFNNGDLYEGEYKDDQRNGIGKLIWPNGESYYGEFKDGRMHGQGKKMLLNGTIQQGNWLNNKFKGQK